MENAEQSNAELRDIYVMDQKEREGDTRHRSADFWVELTEHDRVRRERVRELLDAGAADTAEDYFHAAMVFQHGTAPADYEMAMRLAKQSWELGSQDGRNLYAKAEDRWLLSVGKQQIWGTQYELGGNGIWHIREPFDRTAKNDVERLKMGVDMDAKFKELNENK